MCLSIKFRLFNESKHEVKNINGVDYFIAYKQFKITRLLEVQGMYQSFTYVWNGINTPHFRNKYNKYISWGIRKFFMRDIYGGAFHANTSYIPWLPQFKIESISSEPILYYCQLPIYFRKKDFIVYGGDQDIALKHFYLCKQDYMDAYIRYIQSGNS